MLQNHDRVAVILLFGSISYPLFAGRRFCQSVSALDCAYDAHVLGDPSETLISDTVFFYCSSGRREPLDMHATAAEAASLAMSAQCPVTFSAPETSTSGGNLEYFDTYTRATDTE
jgi:hypothetical protein